MNNSNDVYEESNSISSFGDHRTYSEGEPAHSIAASRMRHTLYDLELQEENKELNSSSDTASFIQNSQIAHEPSPHTNLSFDNDSVMAATSGNIIQLRHDFHNESGEQWDNGTGEESSYSMPTISNRDDMTSQTRSTRTQDQPMTIQRPNFALNFSNLLRRPLDASNSFVHLPNHYPFAISNRNEEQTSNRSEFEEQAEEVLDEILEELKNERLNQKETKVLLDEREKSLNEFYRIEREKLMEDKNLWQTNLKKAQELYSDKIYQLDIGGTHKITVSKNTLCKYPESALAAMFNGKHKFNMHKGRVFIDRDGEAFCFMISYLRNSDVCLLINEAQEEAFYEELNYWQVPLIPNNKNPMEFDPLWCANTLKLENSNSLIRKSGNLGL
jgi:frataxin-like iron-binding protein CyaY